MFEVGDILRLTGRGWDLCTVSEECVSTGALITVYEVADEDSEGRGMYVTFEEAGPERDFWYVEYNPKSLYGVERVERSGGVDPASELEGHLYWAHRISSGRVEGEFKDVPDVPYYQFGDVQVKEITAHLMSFPAQIVQYASRSGRVDGNCKSEDIDVKIQDFKKIIDFAQWEIERLGGLK